MGSPGDRDLSTMASAVDTHAKPVPPVDAEERVVTEKGRTSIDLSFSNIRILNLKEYYHLPHVYCLNLRDNEIEELDGEIFFRFRDLEWLDLRNNKLTDIPATVVEHPTLRVLLLSNNNIKKLPIELGSLPNLAGLRLNNNPLEFPSPTVLEKGNSSVIRFLRSSWRAHIGITGDMEEPGEELGHSDGKVKRGKLKKFSKFALRKRYKPETENFPDASEEIWLKKLGEIFQEQEAKLQKMKDQEMLKEWRDKYRQQSENMDLSELKLQSPPFAFDEFYGKIPSRKDLNLPIEEINQRQASRDRSSLPDMDNSIDEVVRKFESIPSLNCIDENQDPRQQMTLCVQNMKRIKEIQKALEDLRMRDS